MNLNKIRTLVIPVFWMSLAVVVAGAQPADNHYEAARIALAKGDATKARRELRESLWNDPLQSQSHFLLATLLARDGNLDEAMAGYQEVVKLDPNNAVARYNLGTAALLHGEPLMAARSLEDALAIRPNHVPTYNNLAKAYFLTGLPELALATYQGALRLEPTNAIARRGVAVLTQAATGQTDSGTARSAVTNTPPPTAVGGKGKSPGIVEAPGAPRPHTPAELDNQAKALRELLRDLPHVTVERRANRLTLTGWTSGKQERAYLDRVLGKPVQIEGVTTNDFGEAQATVADVLRADEILDLTTDDVGDPHRMLEVDAILFVVTGIDSQSVGHDFLRRVTVNASVADGASAGFTWLYSAAISYEVNIANATRQRIALLARPHLSTLSGSAAKFIAGGDTVYKVSGTTSGDIKVYPFGTSLDITPTLLRTTGADGIPRVRMVVTAGRRTILTLDSPEAQATGESVYANVSVTSEAVLDLNQTLILTGLNQRESTTSRSGVPILKSIPVIKYLVSEQKTTTTDLAIIILLTPRDAAYWDEQNARDLAAFVEKRRAYVEAMKGTPEDLERFKERYPDWNNMAPNRFASHFFLIQNSEIYRQASGMDLANENMDFDLLGKATKQKNK